MATLAAGTPAQRAMAQDAVNRWWWPSLMMFGPLGQGFAELRRAAALGREAEEQRRAAPAVREPHRRAGEGDRPHAPRSGRSRYDETTENWTFGPIDWDEFWRVVKGDGPCNRERLAARTQGARRGRVGARARHARTRRSSNDPRRQPAMSDDDRSPDRRRSGRSGRCSLQPPKGAPHEHAGSVHAADAEQALAERARRLRASRRGGEHLGRAERRDHGVDARRTWVRSSIPGNDKPYRHPQFYKVPRGVRVV